MLSDDASSTKQHSGGLLFSFLNVFDISLKNVVYSEATNIYDRYEAGHLIQIQQQQNSNDLTVLLESLSLQGDPAVLNNVDADYVKNTIDPQFQPRNAALKEYGTALLIQSSVTKVQVTTTNCVFKYFRVAEFGGALLVYGKQVSFTDTSSTFAYNFGLYGGALSIINPVLLSLTDTTFNHNVAIQGGGVFVAFDSDDTDLFSSKDFQAADVLIEVNQVDAQNNYSFYSDDKEIMGGGFFFMFPGAYFSDN